MKEALGWCRWRCVPPSVAPSWITYLTKCRPSACMLLCMRIACDVTNSDNQQPTTDNTNKKRFGLSECLIFGQRRKRVWVCLWYPAFYRRTCSPFWDISLPTPTTCRSMIPNKQKNCNQSRSVWIGPQHSFATKVGHDYDCARISLYDASILLVLLTDHAKSTSIAYFESFFGPSSFWTIHDILWIKWKHVISFIVSSWDCGVTDGRMEEINGVIKETQTRPLFSANVKTTAIMPLSTRLGASEKATRTDDWSSPLGMGCRLCFVFFCPKSPSASHLYATFHLCVLALHEQQTRFGSRSFFSWFLWLVPYCPSITYSPWKVESVESSHSKQLFTYSKGNNLNGQRSCPFNSSLLQALVETISLAACEQRRFLIIHDIIICLAGARLQNASD